MLLLYGVMLFAGPSLPLLLPVLALNVLQVDARALGVLFSAVGIGAVLGVLLLASVPGTVRKQLLVYAALAIWTASLLAIGFSRSPLLTFAALVLFGGAQSVVGAITATLLQARLPGEKRGRAMSLNSLLVMGVRPLGDFPAGALISLAGAPFTAACGSAMVGALSLVLIVRGFLRID